MKTVLLGDVVGHFKGLAFKSKDYQKHGVPIIKVSNFTLDGVDPSNLDYVPESIAASSQSVVLKNGDVVIATVGSWPSNPASVVGKTIKIPSFVNGALLNQNAVSLRHKSGDPVEQKYIYYCLKNPKFIDYLVGGAQGSANQASITLHNIFKYKINDFDYETKRSIVETLSSIDEKIELNRRMNETLEQIGHVLFKNYFIDNPEAKAWPVETIGKQCQVLLGGTPSRAKPEFWQNGNVGWINSGKVNEFRIVTPSENITEEALKKSAAKLLPAGATVLAITGATLGQVSRIEKDFAANQSVIGIIGNEKVTDEYIYFWVKHNIGEIIGHQTGGAQQHINRNNVANFELLLPPGKIFKEFQECIKPIVQKIAINCFQVENLTRLRDSLLPRLISGKIEI